MAKPSVTVVDYHMGNVRSVVKAFTAVGAKVHVSDKAKVITRAERIVLPGVGAFGEGMKNLRQLGLLEPLTDCVLKRGRPFLGICLGMQVLATEGFEHGHHQGLGWIPAAVKRFESLPQGLKVPHIGWNNVAISDRRCPLFADENLVSDNVFYFLHSYYVECESKDIAVAACEYGRVFCAALQKQNIFATQFHPEKSQKAGLLVLSNFLNS